MLASTASAPRVTRCSLGLYWSRDLCSKQTGWLTGWLGDVILSRSDSERQRNLMMHAQCPLPVYYSQVEHILTLLHGSSNSIFKLVQRTRPPTPGMFLRSAASSSENSPASSPWGSPRSSPSSSLEPGYGSPDQTGVPPSRSSTPHPDMPGVEWFPRQEGSEMTRLPADITQVLAPRPSRATTSADEDDEPSITELCVSYTKECAILNIQAPLALRC